MSEVLVSPDAVKLMQAWLVAELPDVPDHDPETPIYRAVPNPRPASFLTVQQTGGPGIDERLHVIDGVQLTIDAWAGRIEQAAALAQNARGVALAARGVVLGDTQVYRVQDGGAPVPLPDESDQPRVTFTITLTLRRRRPPIGS
jgi:hypothetical protein